jgi:hypothetical protein
MNERSYVSIEQNVCPICGTAFDTGALLIDKRLRPSLERHTATGWKMCPDHQAKFDAGFVALVEYDPARSTLSAHAAHVRPQDVHRTGRVLHLKRELFE